MMGNVRGKNIAQTATGFDQQRLVRINLNFSPQPHDQHVDSAVKDLGAFAVGQFKQLFTAQYPAGVLRLCQQQAIFALG